MQQELPEWLWHWILSVERRLTRQDERQRHGKKTTDDAERQTWAPRDWMMAFAGLSMLLATLSEKVGWTTFGAFLVKLYGPR